MFTNLRLNRWNLIDSIVLQGKERYGPLRATKKDIKRILIISWGRLGDLVLSTMLLQALREKYTHAHISYVTNNEGIEILKSDPNIDALIPANLETYKKLIKNATYDLAIDSFGGRVSAFMAYISGAKRLIISHIPQLDAHFNTIGILPVRFTNKNIKDYFLNIAYALDIKIRNACYMKPHLSITKKETGFAKKYLQSMGLNQTKFIVGMQPAGHYETWPDYKYAELGRLLATNQQAKILIFQGPGQKCAAKKIHKLMPKQSILLPYLKTRDYFSILSRCNLFITAAGGPEHVGPALGVPTIAIITAYESSYWIPHCKESFYLPICSQVRLRNIIKGMSKKSFGTPVISKYRKNFEMIISTKLVYSFVNSQKVVKAIKTRNKMRARCVSILG